MVCDYCDAEFSGELEEVEHVLEEHGDELTSHDKDKAKRRLNKLRAQEDAETGPSYAKIGVLAAALLVLVGGGYALVEAGVISVSSQGATTAGDVALGSPGSTHEHAQFAVYIDGDRVEFSKPQYQIGGTQNSYVHFEGGDGVTIHKHATGVTIAYALDHVDFTLEDGCLTTPQDSEWAGQRFCEDSGDLSVTVDGSSVDPLNTVIQDGQNIRVSYTSE